MLKKKPEAGRGIEIQESPGDSWLCYHNDLEYIKYECFDWRVIFENHHIINEDPLARVINVPTIQISFPVCCQHRLGNIHDDPHGSLASPFTDNLTPSKLPFVQTARYLKPNYWLSYLWWEIFLGRKMYFGKIFLKKSGTTLGKNYRNSGKDQIHTLAAESSFLIFVKLEISTY